MIPAHGDAVKEGPPTTMVWCERGESVKAEREEQKQMVHACVERRERSESRWCVRAWSEERGAKADGACVRGASVV